MSNLVTGLGGLFFRARDEQALALWYEKNFGINSFTSNTLWQQQSGVTVFSPFKHNSDYFPAEQQFMINLRVTNLDQLLEELKANDVRIDDKRMDEVYGKFAWVYDPEGNKIELWQPTDTV